VVIDAAAMPFLDAAGIAAFVAVHRHTAMRDINVGLINVQPLVSRVLHVVELVDFFHVTAPDPPHEASWADPSEV
jgi:anti-anti-sigma regulatory factor